MFEIDLVLIIQTEDTGESLYVAVKRGLKVGQTKGKAEKIKVRWTIIVTELPEKLHKSSRIATPQRKRRQRRQPAWRRYAR